MVGFAGSPMLSLLTHMALMVNMIQQSFFPPLWSFSRVARVGHAQGLSLLMDSLLQMVGIAKPIISSGSRSMQHYVHAYCHEPSPQSPSSVYGHNMASWC